MSSLNSLGTRARNRSRRLLIAALTDRKEAGRQYRWSWISFLLRIQ